MKLSPCVPISIPGINYVVSVLKSFKLLVEERRCVSFDDRQTALDHKFLHEH